MALHLSRLDSLLTSLGEQIGPFLHHLLLFQILVYLDSPIILALVEVDSNRHLEWRTLPKEYNGSYSIIFFDLNSKDSNLNQWTLVHIAQIHLAQPKFEALEFYTTKQILQIPEK